MQTQRLPDAGILFEAIANLSAASAHTRSAFLGDPVLRKDVEAAGAEHIQWRRAPHRKTRSRESLFINDWTPEGFAAMRDNLAIGPAAAFAADVRDELERRPAAAVLTEMFLSNWEDACGNGD